MPRCAGWCDPLPTYRSWRVPHVSLATTLVLVFLFLVASDRRAFAQASTATVRGVVVDPGGRLVANAIVFLTNRGTSQRRTAITDAAGLFTFAQVPPSTYTIEATTEAFSSSLLSALTLNVGDELAVTLELRLPGVEAVVEVRAEGSRIQESPAVGTVIDRSLVENMPLSGRTFQSLFDLTPGARQGLTVSYVGAAPAWGARRRRYRHRAIAGPRVRRLEPVHRPVRPAPAALAARRSLRPRLHRHDDLAVAAHRGNVAAPGRRS
ncbi:MAG: hypothetical protein GEV06_12710 [Luteitalea sp.]|nr:hypothetical protein [Luteitalea sp.]